MKNGRALYIEVVCHRRAFDDAKARWRYSARNIKFQYGPYTRCGGLNVTLSMDRVFTKAMPQVERLLHLLLRMAIQSRCTTLQFTSDAGSLLPQLSETLADDSAYARVQTNYQRC